MAQRWIRIPAWRIVQTVVAARKVRRTDGQPGEVESDAIPVAAKQPA